MPNISNIGHKIKFRGLNLKMGASESKVANGDRPEDGEEFHTPIANRRVQKLIDPRSPTDDIQRTPIERSVEDSEFQDPRSPTAKIARTPVPDDSDPRSPSAGREPGPFVFPTPEDPRSPSRIIARTPITKDAPTESSIETVTVHQADQPEPSENTSNNNQQESGTDDLINDVTKLSTNEDAESGVFQIEKDTANLVSEGDNQECHEEGQKNGLAKVNTPEYEMELAEMVERQTIANKESENQDRATLVLSNREMIFLTELPPSPISASSKVKKHNIRRSLKEKFHSTLPGSSQRSPLATRNLIEDSPDPKGSSAQKVNPTRNVGVAYQKVRMRRRLMDGRKGPEQYTVQALGRYQPVVDKENY